jgi:hypothetical protein
MKKLLNGMIVFAVGLLAPQTARSQGTSTYISSLGLPSAGTEEVGSDSWIADQIKTGNNPGGYALDTIQLAMAPASGAPSGFTVMLYSAISFAAILPGTSLGTLSGPTDPETDGTYTYTASDLTLSPSTFYFIVVTAGTPVASGLYAWSFASSLPSSSGGWDGAVFFITSSDGSTWSTLSNTDGDLQYALTATPTPEPNTLGLLGLSGMLFFAWRRWQAKAQTPIAR